jgi:hypothetical protein
MNSKRIYIFILLFCFQVYVNFSYASTQNHAKYPSILDVLKNTPIIYTQKNEPWEKQTNVLKKYNIKVNVNNNKNNYNYLNTEFEPLILILDGLASKSSQTPKESLLPEYFPIVPLLEKYQKFTSPKLDESQKTARLLQNLETATRLAKYKKSWPGYIGISIINYTLSSMLMIGNAISDCRNNNF